MALFDYATPNGIMTPDTSDLRTEIEGEYTDALGDDISTDSSSDIGRLIDAELAARTSVLNIVAYIANQFNPNYAEGVFLDADYALMGGERDQAERSTVTLTCTGVSGTIITSGSYVEDDDGQQWETAEDATIGDDNTITVSAWSVEYGAISADAGTITKISTGITGWETVTNESAAIEGSEEQSDVSARSQRKVELGQNAKGNSYAVLAAVNALEGVETCVYRENLSDETATIDGIGIAAYASYLCVSGGTDSEIAEAYHKAKGGGNPYQGDESEVYTDPYSGQEVTVKFDRPTDYPLYIKITASISSSTDPESDIKEAITEYADGNIDGYTGFMLGEDVSSFELAAGVNEYLSDIFIRSVSVSTDGTNFSSDTIELNINERASIDEDNITVTVV